MKDSPSACSAQLVRLHLLIGWGGLLVFLLLGVALETFHAFKWPFYLDVDNETRRLMWRLAHSHGALLCLLHLALSWTFTRLGEVSFPDAARLISRCLSGASLLLPAGFFLGGIFAADGDPGALIALVPAGAVLLFAAVVLVVRQLLKVSFPAED